MESPESPFLIDFRFPDFPLYVPNLDTNDSINRSVSSSSLLTEDNDEAILYNKIFSAACTGNEDKLKDIQSHLLKYPDVVNKLDPGQNAAPLHFACMKGHLNIVNFLLVNGAEIDVWNGGKSVTPLICAAAHNHLDTVKYLLNQGADVNIGLNDPNADTSLLWAVRRGHQDVVSHLIEEGKASQTSVVVYSETPIHAAITSGHSEILRMLIQAKGKADLSMGQGRHTPLHLACSGEYANALECCKILLETNLDTNVKDFHGRTPLHLAGGLGTPDSDIVRALISHRAEVDIRDKNGRTPLFYFIKDTSHYIESLEVLVLDGKCDLNVQDEHGYTPLHICAFNEASIAAELLLMNGADYSIRADVGSGASALSLLLRRIPSTPSILRRVLNNAVTLTGYDGNGVCTGSKKICKVKVNYNYVVSSTPSSKVNGPDSVDKNNATTLCLGSGTHRRNAKVWARSKNNSRDYGLDEEQDPMLNYKYGNRKETSKIKCLIDENQGKLLLHPVIHSFLALKWQKAMPIFIAIFAFKFLLVLLFSVYVHLPYYFGKKRSFIPTTRNVTNETEGDAELLDPDSYEFSQTIEYLDDKGIPAWFVFFYGVNVVLAMVNGVMELAQLIRSPKRSFFSLEPLIFLAVLTIMIFYTDPSTSWRKIDRYLHRTLAAAGIWLAWVDVWIYMGRFPVFGHSIRIFFKVLYNFVAFILPHFCLFIGFILAFTLIFVENSEFSDLAYTISKSVRIMAGDITFPLSILKEHEKHGYFANLIILYIYTAYVSTVGIVLMNLLIGLAVHDIQGIYKEASMNRLTKQTILLNTLESNFSGSWVVRWVPNSFLKNYINLFHPASLNKTLLFRPFDPRDKKLNVELKRALVKLKTDTATLQRANTPPTSSEGQKDLCENCSRNFEGQGNELSRRVDDLVDRMDRLMRQMERITVNHEENLRVPTNQLGTGQRWSCR